MMDNYLNLLLVFVAAFVGSGLKAIGGFGFATLATPAVALFWDMPTAIAVISIPTMLTSILNAHRTREAAKEGLGQFFPFMAASLAGLTIGLMVLLHLDTRFMKFFLGAFLIGQVIWQWLHIDKSEKAPENSSFRGIGMGLLAGIMLGTVGMPSHVMATYLTGLSLSKIRYLFVLSISQVTIRIVAVVSLAATGAYSKDAIALMVAVTVPVFAGFFLGTRLFDWLPEKAFFRTVMVLLLMMAASLLVINRSVLSSL